MYTIQDLFSIGMSREIPELLSPPVSPFGTYFKRFDVGASGNKVAFGCEPLGLPNWRWPQQKLPCGDNEADFICAYHFLEHLSGEDAISFLAEVQRALTKGGVFQFCIPYFDSELANQDLTHKSFWTEDSFKILFNNSYYEPKDGVLADQFRWKMKVHTIFIMGIVRRNLCLLGQLVKTEY